MEKSVNALLAMIYEQLQHRRMTLVLCVFSVLTCMSLVFNSSVSVMSCFALFSLVYCDLSSSHMLFPLTIMGTLFLESLGGSRRSFGDTPVPDLLMRQYVTTQMGLSHGWDTYEMGIHFLLTIICLFNYACCFASIKFSNSRQHIKL